MAVYTTLSHEEIAAFIAQYDLGEFEDASGISEGVTNTNYLVATSRGKFILTLFEQHFNIEDLPYFVSLMEWWNAKGVTCPMPQRMKDGRALAALKERPALLVSFLDGAGVHKISLEHVHLLGEEVAKMHVAGLGFPHERANPLSLKGWEKLVDQILPRADEIEPGLRDIIRDEYNYLSEHWPESLPGGPIHADLFPDNVFFEKKFGEKPRFSGIIDVYFACNDAWAYDLAICINAWCFDDRQRFVKERAEALMGSYTGSRPLSPEEEAAMPLLLRGAALRFLLTRAADWLKDTGEADVTKKDPRDYLARLTFFQEMR